MPMPSDLLFVLGFSSMGWLLGIQINHYRAHTTRGVKFSYLRYIVTIALMIVAAGFLGKIDNEHGVSSGVVALAIGVATAVAILTVLVGRKFDKSK